MSKKRQKDRKLSDIRAWRPDDKKYSAGLALASSSDRQKNFDPNETEVEYYNYTENNSQFDPEGKDTIIADQRHSNVPDDMVEIPPMLTNATRPPPSADYFLQNAKYETAAHKARWGGWSEVRFDDA